MQTARTSGTKAPVVWAIRPVRYGDDVARNMPAQRAGLVRRVVAGSGRHSFHFQTRPVFGLRAIRATTGKTIIMTYYIPQLIQTMRDALEAIISMLLQCCATCIETWKRRRSCRAENALRSPTAKLLEAQQAIRRRLACEPTLQNFNPAVGAR